MRFFRIALCLFLIQIGFIYGNQHESENQKKEKETIRVLLIGNSLMYSNDLPQLLKEEALKIDVKLRTTMVAYPNYALIDHWNEGKVQKNIKNGDYDYVIVQQGPSSQEFGRQILLEYGEKFKNLCDKNDCELVYFMVWPSKTYYATFDRVIKNHREASEKNNALLSPVGEVWKQHFDKTGDFSYYDKDGFHPSVSGSKIAAKTIIETLIQSLKNQN